MSSVNVKEVLSVRGVAYISELSFAFLFYYDVFDVEIFNLGIV